MIIPQISLKKIRDYEEAEKRLYEEISRKQKTASDKFNKSIDVQDIYSSKEKFEKVFPLLSDEEKKQVLKELFVTEKKNEEIDAWLNENYTNFMKKTWRDKKVEEGKK